MVERVASNRTEKKSLRGGRRPGAGRKFGTVSEAKRVARAKAAMEDKLPHELLLEWARTGRMRYPSGNTTELDPADRISCAKGCAAYYKAPYQSTQAPGEQPPVIRIEIDNDMVAALANKSPDKLEVLRDVLKALQAGGADVAQLALDAPRSADPSRYARMLSESSETAGSA